MSSIQRMRHFLAVADEGAFGRAAERLGMAQPPLSQSILRLERELGLALFERTRKGVRLTPAGAAYLAEARVAVAAADRAVSLARAAGNMRHPVRVGMIPVAIWGPLRSLLEIARAMQIPIELIAATTSEQLRGLAAGEIDLAFVAPPFEAVPRMRTINLASESVVAAIPAKLAPLDDGPVPLSLLADRFILGPREDDPTYYDGVLAFFRSQGFNPTILHSPRLLTGFGMVAAGLGSTMVRVPFARNIQVRGVAYRPIDRAEAIPTRPLALAHMPLSAQSAAARLLECWRREQQVPEDPLTLSSPAKDPEIR